ncbi:MAG TPA: hypothetical protein VGB05_05290, partial [Pyrinomonadaceae bacterium]
MRKLSAIINSNARALLLFVCLSATVHAQQAQPAAAETPATRRVAELIKIINTPDAAATKKFIEESYGSELAQMPMSAHLNFIAQMRDRTRGVEFHGIQDSNGATGATALLRSKLTGDWMGLLVRVEANAPHRITGISTRPPKVPAGERAAKKLTDAERARELEAYVQKLAEADTFSGAVLLAKDGKVL